MLVLLKEDGQFEFVETINSDDVDSFESYNNNIFAYFEWHLNEDLKLKERNSNNRCISIEDDIYEANRIKYWRHKISDIIYKKLDDDIFYKYIPYYVKSKDDYKEKMLSGEIQGGILECIGFVMLSQNNSIRIIDMNSTKDIYIYLTLDNKLVIDLIKRKDFKDSIKYYDNLFHEVRTKTKIPNQSETTNPIHNTIISDDETDYEIDNHENETENSHNIEYYNHIIQNSYLNDTIQPTNTIYQNLLNIQPENILNFLRN
tara:strand:- start:2902 stop:3678 length:777 start_codon:yes stop_codon:yes gene_type:complete